MSVLAHVLLGGALKEPAATQALAYILRANADILRAFVRVLRDANIEFELGHIEAERKQGEGRPDLTVHDSEGRVRIFVENKFWAGLTDSQPVAYLDQLSEGYPSGLLFIVPEKRVVSVWRELKARSREAGLTLTEEAENWVHIGRKTMAIASWSHVLERLLAAADSKGDEGAKRDILQLRGLTRKIDSEAFLPLQDDEVTDQGMARRLMNYIELLNSIVSQLVDDGIADTKGYKSSGTFDYISRYFRVHDEFELSLSIPFKTWRDHGISPLWLAPQDRTIGAFQKIYTDFTEVKILNERPRIPIRLKTGVEMQRVVNDAAAQIKRIADVLRGAHPNC